MGVKSRKIDDALKQLHKAQHDGGALGPPTHVTDEGWCYRADTQCFVENLHYDFISRQGTLWMRPGSCTDMSGCIALFQAIDPQVRSIYTMAGGKADTAYWLAGGEWRAGDFRVKAKRPTS